MKSKYPILLLLVTMLIGACASMKTAPAIVGKWKLTETLADPGDGSGRWTPAAAEQYLVFKADGTVEDTQNSSYRSYSVVDSTKLELTAEGGQKQTVTFRLNGDALQITPRCIEACGFRYTRVN